MEFVTAENSDLFVCTVHPCMIETDVFRSPSADLHQLHTENSKPAQSSWLFSVDQTSYKEPSSSLSCGAFTAQEQFSEWEDVVGDLGYRTARSSSVGNLASCNDDDQARGMAAHFTFVQLDLTDKLAEWDPRPAPASGTQ